MTTYGQSSITPAGAIGPGKARFMEMQRKIADAGKPAEPQKPREAASALVPEPVRAEPNAEYYPLGNFSERKEGDEKTGVNHIESLALDYAYTVRGDFKNYTPESSDGYEAYSGMPSIYPLTLGSEMSLLALGGHKRAVHRAITPAPVLCHGCQTCAFRRDHYISPSLDTNPFGSKDDVYYLREPFGVAFLDPALVPEYMDVCRKLADRPRRPLRVVRGKPAFVYYREDGPEAAELLKRHGQNYHIYPASEMPPSLARAYYKAVATGACPIKELSENDLNLSGVAQLPGVLTARNEIPSAADLRALFAFFWDNKNARFDGLSYDENPFVWRAEFETLAIDIVLENGQE